MKEKLMRKKRGRNEVLRGRETAACFCVHGNLPVEEGDLRSKGSLLEPWLSVVCNK
jgi:hypothetical protein